MKMRRLTAAKLSTSEFIGFADITRNHSAVLAYMRARGRDFTFTESILSVKHYQTYPDHNNTTQQSIYRHMVFAKFMCSRQ